MESTSATTSWPVFVSYHKANRLVGSGSLTGQSVGNVLMSFAPLPLGWAAGMMMGMTCSCIFVFLNGYSHAAFYCFLFLRVPQPVT